LGGQANQDSVGVGRGRHADSVTAGCGSHPNRESRPIPRPPDRPEGGAGISPATLAGQRSTNPGAWEMAFPEVGRGARKRAPPPAPPGVAQPPREYTTTGPAPQEKGPRRSEMRKKSPAARHFGVARSPKQPTAAGREKKDCRRRANRQRNARPCRAAL